MMTMLQRIRRALAPRASISPGFDRYYSLLLYSSDGASGLPSAREALKDREAILTMASYMPHL